MQWDDKRFTTKTACKEAYVTKGGLAILTFSNVSIPKISNTPYKITNLTFKFVNSSIVIGEREQDLDLLVAILTGSQKLSKGTVEGDISKLPVVIDLRNSDLFKHLNGTAIKKIFKKDFWIERKGETISKKYSSEFHTLSGYEKFELLCDLALSSQAEIICFINPENHLNYKELDAFQTLLGQVNGSKCVVLLFTTKEQWNERLHNYDQIYFLEGKLSRERR